MVHTRATRGANSKRVKMVKKIHPKGRVNDAPAGLKQLLFFFFTLVTGPGRSLSLKLSNTRVYEPR